MRRQRTRTPLIPQTSRLDATDVAGQHGFYAEAHQDRARSSLLASGIRASVYSFLQNGRKCTCRMQASLLDGDGNLSADGVASILRGSADAGHSLAGITEKPTFDAADVGLDELDESYDRLLDGLEGLEIDDDEGGARIARGDTLGLNDVIDELSEADPDAKGLDFIGGMAQDRCGVCFGSGFEGGFRLVGGHRTVLTSQSPISAETDCRIDERSSPHRFADGRLVVFDNVRLPHRAGQRLHILRLWRNDIQIPRASYSASRSLIEGALSDGTDAGSRESGGIQVRVEAADGAPALDFTHLEIQAIRSRTPIDIIQAPDDFHPNPQGNSATATIQLPPDAPVSKFSVVRDSKYGRAWQVSRVAPHLNNRGIAVWYEAEARLAAQHELVNRLVG